MSLVQVPVSMFLQTHQLTTSSTFSSLSFRSTRLYCRRVLLMPDRAQSGCVEGTRRGAGDARLQSVENRASGVWNRVVFHMAPHNDVAFD